MKSYSAQEIADAVDASYKAVRKRAEREGWPSVEIRSRGKGGKMKIYHLQGLPGDIQQALVTAGQVDEQDLALLCPEAQRLFIHRSVGTKGLNPVAATPDLPSHPDSAPTCAPATEAARFWAHLPEKERAIALARWAVLQAADRFTANSGRDHARDRVRQLTAFYARLGGALDAGGDASREALLRLGFAEDQVPDVMAHIRKAGFNCDYRWREAFEQAREAVGMGVIGLSRVSKSGLGFGARSLTLDMIAYARSLIVKGQVKLEPLSKHAADGRLLTCNKMLLHRRLSEAFGAGKLPHYAHFTRWVNQYLLKEGEGLAAVVLPGFWRSTFAPKAGIMSQGAGYAGQRWEVDGTRADVMLKDGRHEIIVAVDVFSRDLVVEIDRNASAITVAKTFYNGILRWGVPEEIKGDRGTIFKAKHIQDACGAIDTNLKFCDAYAPNQKPHVESAIGTITKMLFEGMTWYIGHDPRQRKRIEEYHHFERVFYHKRGEKISCDADAAGLRSTIDHWLEKVYRVESHQFADCRLGRPKYVWERISMSPKRAPQISNPDVLEMLLAPGIERNFDSGVNWLTETYRPADMESWEAAQRYQQRKVMFRPKLSDVNLGGVWEITDDGRTGKFICKVAAGIRGGMALDEYMKALRGIQKERKQERKAAERLFGPPSYEEELARKPAPKIAVAGFGGKEFAGEAYRTAADAMGQGNDDTGARDRGAGGGPLALVRDGRRGKIDDERARIESQAEEARQLAEQDREAEFFARIEARDGGVFDWDQVRHLSPEERYDRLIEREARGEPIPMAGMRDMRTFELSDEYYRLQEYFERRKTGYAVEMARKRNRERNGERANDE
jgi:hypothetical protein